MGRPYAPAIAPQSSHAPRHHWPVTSWPSLSPPSSSPGALGREALVARHCPTVWPWCWRSPSTPASGWSFTTSSRSTTQCRCLTTTITKAISVFKILLLRCNGGGKGKARWLWEAAAGGDGGALEGTTRITRISKVGWFLVFFFVTNVKMVLYTVLYNRGIDRLDWNIGFIIWIWGIIG